MGRGKGEGGKREERNSDLAINIVTPARSNVVSGVITRVVLARLRPSKDRVVHSSGLLGRVDHTISREQVVRTVAVRYEHQVACDLISRDLPAENVIPSPVSTTHLPTFTPGVINSAGDLAASEA